MRTQLNIRYKVYMYNIYIYFSLNNKKINTKVYALKSGIDKSFLLKNTSYKKRNFRLL